MSRSDNSGQGDWITGSPHACRLASKIKTAESGFLILKKDLPSENIVRIVIRAPLVAINAKPGQFLLIRPNETSERIPLTISHADRDKGTVTVIFQEVGATTRELGALKTHDLIHDVAGPLGTPSHIDRFGTVACVGGGIGVAVILPVAQALHNAGNRVIGIIGARTKKLLILEDEMRAAGDELLVVTDDGSYGNKGLVTDALYEALEKTKIDLVYAIGPLPMMRAVCEFTRKRQIKTIVSLDPVMIDGTGMCGGCRVTIGEDVKFTCVDGPEFDGHLVDWDNLKARKQIYRAEEQEAVSRIGEREADHAKA